MQVILLDKVANLGSLGDQVNVKAGYARLKFWQLLMLALRKSMHWKLLPSRLKLATKVNCSVPSVLATSLTL